MTSPYTRERLTKAAASSVTLSEALIKLGVDPRSPTRRYLRARMRSMEVDVSHFEPEGSRWTREILSEAVAASTNMYGVLRHLGLDAVGGHHSHISRRVREFGIDTSHFGRAASSSGRACPRRTPEELLTALPEGAARRIPSERLKRAMPRLGTAEKCALCGTEPLWRGRPLALEVDHINGDWRMNQPDNLRLLCPNCHSTTDTYRGSNKGRR